MYTFAVAAALLRVASAIQIQPQTTWGTWQGWGVSLCWWANVFGNRDDALDFMYMQPNSANGGMATYASADGTNLTVPSLGFTIARYNVGGSRNDTVNGTSIVLSPNFPWWKQIKGYWIDGASTDPSSNSWDWTADALQREAVSKAVARGANKVEMFSNSPMWWQLKNHNPSGSDDGSSDNLAPQYWRAHAQYMAVVAEQAVRTWQWPVQTVEPLNEPIATWWKSSGTQEGCHFDASTQASVVQYLRAELDARGLTRETGIYVAASDESLTDMAVSTWAAFNETTRASIDHVNVHGYEGVPGNRAGLYQAAVVQGGKTLQLSEHGEGDATGQQLAQIILLDFAQLHMTSWVYWQTTDGGGWGLVPADVPNSQLSAPNPKYYALAQYSRHIRQGMTIMGSSDNGAQTVVAYDNSTQKLVIVASNLGSQSSSFQYDLSQFSAVRSGLITRWATQLATGGDKYTQYADTTVSNAAFSCTIPANTVVTFEIPGVVL